MQVLQASIVAVSSISLFSNGAVIIVSIITAYVAGMRYITDPLLIVLIVLGVAAVFLIISFLVIRGFENLAETNRIKTEFVNIVSHQLRAPLSNFKWAIDYLMSEDVDRQEQLEQLNSLKEVNDQMIELVSNLLTVAKIEQSKIPLKKNKSSLEDLTREAIKGLKHFADASNVKVEFKPEKDIPLIYMDSSQIRLVIDNLLENAIRYSSTRSVVEQGEIKKINGKVEISIFKKAGSLYFEIKDNGLGIPKLDQKYIFQKFFRAKNVLSHQPKGNGLGLYIAKAIIEQSGGRIGFKSEENKGSIFWFSLPIK